MTKNNSEFSMDNKVVSLDEENCAKTYAMEKMAEELRSQGYGEAEIEFEVHLAFQE